MSATEQWRPVLGFPDYEASSLGRIKSHRRGAQPDGRVLNGWLDKKGYRKVFVYGAAGRAEKFVHVLVAEAFHGARPAGCSDTRHLDGDRTNNTPDNLRFGTRSENELDKVRHGAHHNAAKTHCPAGHPYDADNTYIVPSSGDRNCRTCQRDRNSSRAFRAAGMDVAA